ncbi:acyl-CoA N-acyltransferase [Penicillium verhagenii]|uniref:acyl-CoA N-acyltransferase n=1 Tax=Penicillium verhagenii TaxID=1562060 RepID=UPI002544E5A2|nr:acyl-CoA N-acyltransferase [Penicillium verhagenii]KAJ5939394.1 acyl-CoA N-acyltransferase [Penicillium verhagenii]
MADLHFRIATLNDAPSIQQLVQSAFRAEDSRKDWTADMELGKSFTVSVEEVKTVITNPDSVILLAFTKDNDQEILVASMDTVKRPNNSARFSMVAVNQNYQQAGVGRRALAYAEEYSQQTWGVTTLGLNALSTRQELIAWYLRQGYRKTGEESPFPTEKFPHLDLPEDMCFVEMEKQLA